MKWLLIPAAAIVFAAIAIANLMWYQNSELPSLRELQAASYRSSVPTITEPAPGEVVAADFMAMLGPSDPQLFLKKISENWHPGSAPMLVETYRFSRNREARAGILKMLMAKTGQDFGNDLDRWYHWIWKQEYQPHPDYPKFKSQLYSIMDPRFPEYFANTAGEKIRLDEIRWGGVRRDGIPPLKNPEMIRADEARWLGDDNVVFGIVINGDARCYPKRILAWHEMFKDTIGGQSVCGAY